MTVPIPDDIASQLGGASDVSRRALKAFGAEEYHVDPLSHPDFHRLLGSGTHDEIIEQDKIEYSVYIPKYFDSYEWAIKGKGVFGDIYIGLSGKIFKLNIYDIVTLAQTCEGELASSVCFAEPNIVVVRDTTRENIFSAIAYLACDGFSTLLPETYTVLPKIEEYTEQHYVSKK
jgi:hypothetical protein